MPRKTDSGNPSDWLFFARADLDAVAVLCKQRVSFVVCRSKLAEALEKTLKADLISRGWFLRKIHDLQALREDLETRDAASGQELRNVADELAESYTESRYPGFDLDEDDWPSLEQLLAEVEKYLDEVEAGLNKQGK